MYLEGTTCTSNMYHSYFHTCFHYVIYIQIFIKQFVQRYTVICKMYISVPPTLCILSPLKTQADSRQRIPGIDVYTFIQTCTVVAHVARTCTLSIFLF